MSSSGDMSSTYSTFDNLNFKVNMFFLHEISKIASLHVNFSLPTTPFIAINVSSSYLFPLNMLVEGRLVLICGDVILDGL